MKLRIVSDLHTEFGEDLTKFNYLGEDGLILAGDIGPFQELNHIFSHFVSLGFPRVFYVPGNHEFYGREMRETREQLATLQTENVRILDNRSETYLGVTFIGSTLWTNFRNNVAAKSVAKRGINDFRRIKNFSVNQAESMFAENFAFLNQAIDAAKDRKVVITHFLPADECIAPKYRTSDYYSSLLNYYFANDLGEYIKGLEDTTWVYGHTHDSADFTLGTTRLVCNPRGYPSEFNLFDPDKTIEV